MAATNDTLQTTDPFDALERELDALEVELALIESLINQE
jgi:hypothetical protein